MKVALGVAVNGTTVAVGVGVGVAVDMGALITVAVGDTAGDSVAATVGEGIAGITRGAQLTNPTTNPISKSRARIPIL